MTKTEIQEKVSELRELRRMADELNAEITSIEDALKRQMMDLNTDTLCGDDFKISWKTVTSSRLDSKALKAVVPELYSRFVKETTSRRFSIA